jgi:mono/diheme cytochrome c family protein
MHIGLFGVALGLVLAACGPSFADEPGRQFGHDMMVRFHMHESYSLYAAVERLLLRGKLDDARDLARSIGIAPDEEGLSAWTDRVILVRDRATALASAPSIDEGCRRAARLAEACAGCHVATSAVPEFRNPPALPLDRPTVEARMARHMWAVARIREGVIGSVDESFRAGLEVLTASPLPAPATDEDRAALAKRIHDLAEPARRGAKAGTPEARARMYGEILVTCAACHTAGGKHP